MPATIWIDWSKSEVIGDTVVTTSGSGDQLFVGKMSRSEFRAWVESSYRLLADADQCARNKLAGLPGVCPHGDRPCGH